MRPQTFTVIQTSNDPNDELGLVALTQSGEFVTIWSGDPPAIPPGIHPCLAQALERGSGEIGPCWIEERCGQQVLADLPTPIPIHGAISICVQLADALAALHAHERTHGSVGPSSVAISVGGHPMWIGTGRKQGSTQSDIDDLLALGTHLNPQIPKPSNIRSAASLAAQWREHLTTPSSLSPWLAKNPPKTTDTHTPLSLKLIPLGLLDEVQPDLGDDPQGRGILDRWKTGEDDEFTDDPTVSVAVGTLHTQTRQHILNSLYQALDSAVDSSGSNLLPASFRAELSEEPLDPLPTLNGLEHGPIHNPGDKDERTADVSHPEITRPTTANMEDTTGFTGGIPTPQSVMTGLLMAAVLGMLGAAIMLALVWLIIGDVF